MDTSTKATFDDEVVTAKLTGFEDGYDKGYERGWQAAEDKWRRHAEAYMRLMQDLRSSPALSKVVTLGDLARRVTP